MTSAVNQQRLALHLRGILQGIGLRPFIYRLAHSYQLTGWVANCDDGVDLQIQGEQRILDVFLAQLTQTLPSSACLTELTSHKIAAIPESQFVIANSRRSNSQSIFMCPDLAICAECLAELFDPHNRRYHYPLISCCHCGPRYSITSNLPYDRCNTTLHHFPLCDACQAEYTNPLNRRFHAQTIGCWQCGPQIALYDQQGRCLDSDNPIHLAVDALRQGHIIAIKGVGGFQLAVDATQAQAVALLRKKKHRGSKPFAVMLASLEHAKQLCHLSHVEQLSLISAKAPIVLAVHTNPSLAAYVAPNQALLGVMLANTPLHQLVCSQLEHPLIVTSGNYRGETMYIDNQQAVEGLHGIANYFLMHDRQILTPLDDSIVRVIGQHPTVLRRARGYVPQLFTLDKQNEAILALGGHQKNTIGLWQDNYLILSQHLGDLDQLDTRVQQSKTLAHITSLYQIKPTQLRIDQHHDQANYAYAMEQSLPVFTLQHHHAHILSCMVEHNLSETVLGVAWDGLGLGGDGTLWGGEFLHASRHNYIRIAHCRHFRLPGGVQAIREPRRVAFSLLYQCYGESAQHEALSSFEQQFLLNALQQVVQCPLTSSIGRLIDGFASLLGLCHINEFEGQAAMALEQCAMQACQYTCYPMPVIHSDCLQLDWYPLLEAVIADLPHQEKSYIAASIHQTLADAIYTIATQSEQQRIVLSGGCFQNAYLVDAILNHRQREHYQIYHHHQIPPNDGGLAAGQLYWIAP